MIPPEDRCDLCHELAELDESDLALVACCGAELWLHNRCAESDGPCPRCGASWKDTAALLEDG